MSCTVAVLRLYCGCVPACLPASRACCLRKVPTPAAPPVAWHQGLGPIECLKKHLEDPGHNNIFTSSVGAEALVAVCALSVAPLIIEAKNTLSGDEEEFRPIPW